MTDEVIGNNQRRDSNCVEFFCGRSLGVVVDLEVAYETLPGLVPVESRSEGKSNRASPRA